MDSPEVSDETEIAFQTIVDEIEYKCKTKTEDATTEYKDSIKFKVSIKDGLKVKVKYEQEVETATEETETETSYEVHFDKVIEYTKGEGANEGAAYDWENDLVVQEYSLAQTFTFSDIVDDESGVTSTFSASTPDDVAKFTFAISRGGENDFITANKMKIDFELIGFDWMETDSYVALISTVESERQVEIDYEDDEDDVEDDEVVEDVRISFDDAIEGTNGVRPFGEFTWARDALVMDVNATEATAGPSSSAVPIEVIATSPNDGSDMIAFSFVGDEAHSAPDIYWDPEAGIGYSSAASSSPRRVASSVAAVAVGAAAAAVAMLL